MHASEVCGTSVALAIAEDLIALHGGATTAGGRPLPEAMRQTLRETVFYVAPRLSPDGAEEVLARGRYVRSSPVDDRAARGHAHWVAEDLDGDGRTAYLRVADPDGDLVELRGDDGQPLVPPVMVSRMPEDEGPFFRLYPEGRIANFDGRTVPAGRGDLRPRPKRAAGRRPDRQRVHRCLAFEDRQERRLLPRELPGGY